MLRYFIVLALFLANIGCGRSVWPAHIKFNSNTMSPDVTFVLTQYVKDFNKLIRDVLIETLAAMDTEGAHLVPITDGRISKK